MSDICQNPTLSNDERIAFGCVDTEEIPVRSSAIEVRDNMALPKERWVSHPVIRTIIIIIALSMAVMFGYTILTNTGNPLIWLYQIGFWIATAIFGFFLLAGVIEAIRAS